MPQIFKKFITRWFPALFSLQSVYRFLVRYPNSYLNVTGWLESNRRGYPCKPNGSPLPWLNYPTIAFLENRLQKNMTLFEFGSGYSTLFFANLVARVEAVESDKSWYEKINKSIPGNVKMFFEQQDVNGHYCRTILSSGSLFNIVIVDGRDRVNCVKQSVHKLTDDGVILLDDSQRDEYREVRLMMNDLGFLHLELEGLKPNGFERDSVSVFYRKKNCLGL